jgi:hypothetical protein
MEFPAQVTPDAVAESDASDLWCCAGSAPHLPGQRQSTRNIVQTAPALPLTWVKALLPLLL